MLAKIKSFVKSHWHLVLVILFAILFFLLSSSYNYFTQGDDFVKWGSPDESANYVFTKLYGQTGEMVIYEKANLHVMDIIRPRSFRSDLGSLKPVSFLGLIIIYGKIIAITGYRLIPYLTPFFASLGLVFYYLIIRRLFSNQLALISSILLMTFPVLLYYSARSMFHNVLFISLLTIGLYFALRMTDAYHKFRTKDFLKIVINWRGLVFASVSGIFFGLAIITRTSELLWLAPMMVVLWLFNVRKIGITKLMIFCAFVGIAVLPVACWNIILYGSSASGGYPEMNKSIYEISNAGSEIVRSASSGTFNHLSETFRKLTDSIFIFGIDLKQSLNMSYYYFARMFYWIFWPFALGLIIYLQGFNEWKIRHFAYLSSFLVISAILVLYYGSWDFHDNPNPNSFTIGNSYTRYWLPIYMMAMPFVAIFISRFSQTVFAGRKRMLTQPDLFDTHQPARWQKIRNKFFAKPRKSFLINGLIIVIISMISVISLFQVTFGSEEGLYYSYQKQNIARVETAKVLENTERNSVVITLYHDKLLFPERKVIVGLFSDEKMNELYGKLIDHLPVYYYNFSLPAEDVTYLNTRKFIRYGYHIEPVATISSDFSLYRLLKNPPPLRVATSTNVINVKFQNPNIK